MRSGTFRWGRLAALVLVLGIAAGSFAYRAYTPVDEDVQTPETGAQENAEPPVFSWKFAKSTSLDLDGLPQTDISLEARYPDGTAQTKPIDTKPGSCNELPDADASSVPGSATVQCYAAGMGYRFRIMRSEASYLVQRIVFEEALPDREPPAYGYETVTEFPAR